MTDRSKIIEVMSAAICGPGTPCEACRNSAERAFSALQAEGLAVVPGWQPIGIAPRDGTRVLGFFPDLQDGYHDTNWTRHGVWASRAYPNQPTYFQPLPTPPTNSTKKESDE